MQKICLLTNMLPPYRIPLFRAINKNADVELYVLLETIRESNRQWDTKLENLDFFCSVLDGLSIPLKHVELHFNPSIFFVLSKISPDALIICGYSSFTAWMALLWAKTNRIPVVLWSGSTLLSSRYLKGPVYLMRKFFVALADAYITYGIKATEFLIYHGAPKNRIVTGCNVGDVHFFKSVVDQWRQNHSEWLGERKPSFLFTGQLIPRKGIRELFRALGALKDYSWELTIAGDGPLHGELSEFAKTVLPNRIRFVGFHQPTDLIRHFGLCDVLLIPSLVEVGSIVMSEGLASGLYILASKYDGSTYNLIKEPDNGIVVDPQDHKDLTAKLRWLLEKKPWENQRTKIAESIKTFTPEYNAECFIQALKRASDNK